MITSHDCDDAEEDHYPFVFFYHDEVYDCVVYHVEVPIDPSFLYHPSVGHDDDGDAVYSYDWHVVLDHPSQAMEDYFFLQ